MARVAKAVVWILLSGCLGLGGPAVGLAADARGTSPPADPRSGGAVADQVVVERTPGQVVYHGDVKTKVFHQPGCQDYDCPACRATFTTRFSAIAARYQPCKVCKP